MRSITITLVLVLASSTWAASVADCRLARTFCRAIEQRVSRQERLARQREDAERFLAKISPEMTQAALARDTERLKALQKQADDYWKAQERIELDVIEPRLLTFCTQVVESCKP